MGTLGENAVTPFPNPRKIFTNNSPDQIRGELNQLAKHLTDHDADASLHTVTTSTPAVTTSALQIYPAITHSAVAWVNGDTGSGAAFVDMVAWNGGGSAVAVSSTTVLGAPAARTYTIAAGVLKLTMAAGTYAVTVVPIVFTS